MVKYHVKNNIIKLFMQHTLKLNNLVSINEKIKFDLRNR